jgi:hypothetical protein
MKELQHVRLHAAAHLTQADLDMLLNSLQESFPDGVFEVVQDDDVQPGQDIAIEHVGTAYVVEEGDNLTKDQLVREFITGDQHVTIIVPMEDDES